MKGLSFRTDVLHAPGPGRIAGPAQLTLCWSRTERLRHGVRHCSTGFSHLAHATGAGRRLCRRLVLGPVIKDLQAHDLPVLAPPNPLRGLAHDAEYIAS